MFNAPFSNTRSVAELVIGEIVILLRRIVSRSNAAHQGRWDKSADDSYEVRGKTLGIIGMGRIGSELSRRAIALESGLAADDAHANNPLQWRGLNLLGFALMAARARIAEP